MWPGPRPGARAGCYAASLGLRVAYETVPIGGEVDLNRPNLVVICGPRLSRHTAAVLEQDPNLRFVAAPDGCWTIHDRRTGTTHRSGIDQENNADFDVAYLGRLRRPDGVGTLMIFTGIHPQGSLGVVHYLIECTAQMYDAVGTTPFSTLIRTAFDRDTSRPTEIQRISPLCRHDHR